MTDSFNVLLQWLHLHPEFSGLITFVISTAESVALIGTIIPGTVTMTAIGGLAGAGIIPLWSTIICAILGAIVGDGISYWIGYYFREHLYQLRPLKKHPHAVNRARHFVAEHGGKSVFIGRFVGPIRALVPVIAGSLGMSPLRFTIANIASAILWGPIYMLPGILLGALSLELPPDMAIQAITLLLLISVGALIFIWLIRRLHHQLSHYLHRFTRSVWQTCVRTPKYAKLLTLLQHHDESQTGGQISLALTFIISLFLLLLLMIALFFFDSNVIPLNEATLHLFRSIRSVLLDNAMLCLTLLGDKRVLLLAFLITCLALLWKGHYRIALCWYSLAFFTVASTWGIKYLLGVPVPLGVTRYEGLYAFPSAHVTLATVFYGGLTLFIANSLPMAYRIYPYLVATTLIVFISFTRLYFGIHWLTDIIGALLLSSCLLTGFIIIVERKQAVQTTMPFIAIVSAFALAILVPTVGHFIFGQLRENYATIRWPQTSLSMHEWWRNNGDSIPLYRSSDSRTNAQMLTIQWAGNPIAIKQVLVQQGWEIPTKRTWENTIENLTQPETEHLPIFAPLFLDEEPAITMTKKQNQSHALVVWLWDSHKRLTPSGDTIWVGVLNSIPYGSDWVTRQNQQTYIDPRVLFSSPVVGWEYKSVPIGLKMLSQFETTDQQYRLLLLRPLSERLR